MSQLDAFTGREPPRPRHHDSDVPVDLIRRAASLLNTLMLMDESMRVEPSLQQIRKDLREALAILDGERLS